MIQHLEIEARPAHPLAFLVLLTPFGVANGFQTVTLGYLLTAAGVSTEAVAAVVAAFLLPQTWKFLWAPMVDSTLRPRAWYAIGVVLTALGIALTGLIPATAAGLPLITVVGVVTSAASTLVSMAIESMLPHNTLEESRGRASGWMQAGNLGGTGIGGGAALWLAQNLAAPWLPALITAAVCLLCAVPLAWLHEHPPQTLAASTLQPLPSASQRLSAVLRSLWHMARTRRGFLGLLLMVLPAGSGAAVNLWSAVAQGWQASANQVALVNGVLGGVVSMIGCLLGGPLCDRLDRRHAYVVFGACLALCTAAMALAPRTPATFIGFTLLYSLINGLCYTGYAAVALDSTESGSAATQFNAFSSLANAPLFYMALLEGWAYSHHGPAAMLWSETLASLAGIALFGVAVALSRERTAAAPAI